MKQRFFNIVTRINGQHHCFPMFRGEGQGEPTLEEVRSSAEFAALLTPVGIPEDTYGEDNDEDQSLEGEPEDIVATPAVEAAREQVTPDNMQIFGPFETPDNFAKTYRVRRPDCATPIVIVQAMSKALARELVRTNFGPCIGNAEDVTQMMPTPGTNRILAPLR